MDGRVRENVRRKGGQGGLTHMKIDPVGEDEDTV